MSSDKIERNLTEQELKGAFIQVISDKMAKADWYYDYADDESVWAKGSQEMRKIREDVELLSRLEGGVAEAKKLWEQYAPPNSVRPPDFFQYPALLNTVLDGVVMRQDMPSVQEILREIQSNGNRFVAFDSDPLMVPKDRFTGFPSAMAARNFVYKNTTPETLYIAEPIARMLKEIDEALAPDKERLLKEVTERLQEYQKQDKRSRGSDLSR